MAEPGEEHEKTEEPTQRRLEDAYEKGNVAKSQEVNSWFMMLGATLVVLIFARNAAAMLAGDLATFLGQAHALPADSAGLRQLFTAVGLGVLAALGLPFLVMMVAGVAGNLLQHRPVLSLQPLAPKLSKISPLAGIKRLVSLTSLVNFAKSVAKLAIVGVVMVIVLWPARDRLDTLVGLDAGALLAATQELAVKMLLGVLAVLSLLAVADYAHQRTSWWKKLRMTVKELRDEYKQLEGDPQVRAKLRQVRIERGRKRMMANVPRATVVITNPTHYAVALQYEPGMNAPLCLAKGIDAVALRIRTLAEEHGIPIVENPPLARTLHASVEVDEEIPPQHYKAVAEVIGFVMRLRSKRKWSAA